MGQKGRIFLLAFYGFSRIIYMILWFEEAQLGEEVEPATIISTFVLIVRRYGGVVRRRVSAIYGDE